MGKAALSRYALYAYSLTHLPAKDKVRFYYALKGRNGSSGIVSSYHIETVAKSVLLVPEAYRKSVEEFLAYWRCAYTKRTVSLES